MATTKVSGNLVKTATITGNNIATNTITTNNISTSVNLGGPKITSITYPGDDTAANTSGGQTVVLTGNGFVTGASVLLDGVAVGSATVTNTTSISFTTPAKSTGSYIVYVVNTDGSTAILVPGIQYSGVPSFTTAAGTLGSAYEYAPISSTIEATGDGTISYSLYSGSLPDGVTLASNGQLSGTTSSQSGNTTFSFTVRATDAQNQDTDRNFSVTINIDAVSWSAPANNATITTYEYVAISNTFVATSAAGRDITYSANVLPANVSISGSTVSGTPTTVGNTTSLITATSNTTNRTATQTLNFVVQQDTVTWSSPANNVTYTLNQGVSNTTSLSATSAAGFNVSYAANSLPAGLAVSGSTITGTPTAVGNSSSLITATAATTGRTAALTLNWVINIAGDTFWNATSMLLSANAQPTFLTDASLNNSQLTTAGNARVDSFSPVEEGYYSYSFDGASYLNQALSSTITIGTQDFSLEGWGYWTSFNNGTYGAPLVSFLGATAGELMIRANKTSATTTSANFFNIVGSGTYIPNGMYTSGISGGTLYLNRWHHLAVSRVSGVWNFYVDGVSISTVSAGNASLTLPFTNAYIGSDGTGGGGYMTGYVSNVRLMVGSSAYSGTSFTVPTTPLLPIANTQLLTAQSSRFRDNSVRTASTLTPSGSGVKVSPARPFATVYQAGTPYYSTYLDGSGDYLTTANIPAITSDFTIEFWINSSQTARADFLSPRYDYTSTGWFLLTFGLTSTTSIGYYESGGNAKIDATSATLRNGGWHHVALTKSGTSVRLFVDGSQVGTTYTTSQTQWGASGYGWDIGSQQGSNYYNGYISNFRVLNGTALYTSNFTPSTTPLTAITNTQLLTFQDSTFKDNSTNAYTFTVYGNSRPVAISPFAPNEYTNNTITTFGSAYFNGSTDYVTAPANINYAFGTGDFTAECWAYFNGIQSNQSPGLLSVANPNTDVGWEIYYDNSTWGVRSNYANVFGSLTPAPVVGQWYHVAYTRKSGTHYFFVNGALLGTAAGSYTWSDQVFYSGWTPIGQYVNGYVSDARLIKGTALYTSNFAPPINSQLTAVANTQLLTLQNAVTHNTSTAKDNSAFGNLVTRSGNAASGTFSPYGENWSTYFDGSAATQYLSLPTATATALGGFNGKVTTIEFFVNQTQTSTSSTENEIFGTFAAVAANGRFIITLGSASATNQPSKVRFMWTTSTGTTDTIVATNTIPLNTWTHVAIVVDATGSGGSHTVTIYTNGSGETFTGKNFSSQTTTYDRLRVGGNTESYLYGYLSNLRVTRANTNVVGYSGSSISVPTSPLTPLPDTKILLCRSNRIIDESHAVNTVSVLGTPTVRKYSPFGTVTLPKYYSQYFTGSSNYLTLSSGGTPLSLTGDFTVEFWVYPTALVDGNYYHIVSSGFNGQVLKMQYGTGGYVYYYNGSSFNFTPDTTMITNNAWHHFAWVRSGSNSRLYINGTGYSTVTSSMGTVAWDTTFNLAGGSIQENFPGYFSNLRIVKGTAVYDISQNTITVPTAPLTAVSGTQLLTCHSNTLKDDSPNSYTLSITGSGYPKPVSPFAVVASDRSPYNIATFGGSTYFDGSGDQLTAASSSLFAFGTGDFTIEGWIYVNSGTSGTLIDFRTGISSVHPVLYNNSGTLVLYVAGGVRITGGTLRVGEWVHVALVRISGVTKLYQNGIQVGSNYTDTNAYLAGPAYTGAGLSAANALNGYVSDLKVTGGVGVYTGNFYPGASPSTQSTTIGSKTYIPCLLMAADSGGVYDASRTVNFETVGDAKIAGFSPYSGSYYSGYFDGSGDYLTVPDSTNFEIGSNIDFTMECWVNFSNLSGSGNCILGKGASGVYQPYYFYAMDNNTLYYYSSSTGSTWDIANGVVITSSLTKGVWYHIAVSRQGTNTRLFLNGALINTIANSGAALYDNTRAFSVGARSDGTEYCTGYISNVRFVKGTALYTSAFTPSTTPITAVSGTQLLTCQSNTFKDNSTNAATITKNGDAKVVTQNPFQRNTGTSIYFDGTGDYLTSQFQQVHQMVNGDFTVEAWVYRNAIGAEHNIAVTRSSASNDGWNLRINSTNTLQFYYTGGTSVTSTGTIPANVWTHVAVSMSSGTARLFINGTVDGSQGSFGTGTANALALRIGVANDGTGVFNGYITDLRITRYARYTSGFTPPTEPLLAK